MDARDNRPGVAPLGFADDPMVSYGSLSPELDMLLELPAPEDTIRDGLSTTAAEHLGPDPVRMLKAIAAYRGATDKLRARQRRFNLTKTSEIDEATKEEIVARSGRLQVADFKTQQEYLAVGGKLLARFMRECDVQGMPLEDVDPRDFASWLVGLKLSIVRNTYRRYRASAITIIQSIPSHYTDEAVAMLQQYLLVGDDDTQVIQKGDDLLAPVHLKRFEHHHFGQIQQQLRIATRGRARHWLKDWLEAGINTGLRPMEWALTDLERQPGPESEQDRIWLHVISAKGSNGRAAYRTLDLSNFSTGALQAVERMVARSREWVLAGQWSNRQHEVEKLLRKICEGMFSRMHQPYTLYSVRHQFIANMKTINSREEVAAMTDHVLLRNQTMPDGKKRLAWDSHQIGELPAPVPAQVALIKERLELVDLRQLDRAQKKAFREMKPDC